MQRNLIITKVVIIFSILLALTGCPSTNTNCSDESIARIIKTEMAKTLDGRLFYRGYFEEHIHSTIELLELTLEAVRTTSIDPNSTKQYCAAVLKIRSPIATRPNDIVTTINIEYMVQRTDDEKNLYLELQNYDKAWGLIKDTLDASLKFQYPEDESKLEAIQAAKDIEAIQVQAAKDAEMYKATHNIVPERSSDTKSTIESEAAPPSPAEASHAESPPSDSNQDVYEPIAVPAEAAK